MAHCPTPSLYGGPLSYAQPKRWPIVLGNKNPCNGQDLGFVKLWVLSVLNDLASLYYRTYDVSQLKLTEYLTLYIILLYNTFQSVANFHSVLHVEEAQNEL